MGRMERENRVVGLMIGLYCNAHHPGQGLCETCAALRLYAEQRLAHCPYGVQKKSCKNCATHCYRPAMRHQIRAVMRYAGPRMLLRHPWTTLRHLFDR